MLDTLITSKTRIKLLLKFFLNSKNSAYLRNLEAEFGASTNAIRIELNKFEEAGLLHSENNGNKKVFKANTKHPLFKDIQNILLKYTGIDQIVDEIISKLGDIQRVYLTGDLSKGIDGPIIDLIFIGTVNKSYLMRLIGKSEKLINKKIKFIIYSETEFEKEQPTLLKAHYFIIYNNGNQK